MALTRMMRERPWLLVSAAGVLVVCCYAAFAWGLDSEALSRGGGG